MPTSTVEDYLKCILLAQQDGDDGPVSTGQIAASLAVAPGTATAMVKTLADSRLVHYEPYAGVRLSDAGLQLATHVLRRHRLVEAFLVKIMGFRWSEVHDDAEVLEHAISDRLLARIDEMLESPSFDPHGDPIPSPGGEIVERDDRDLLQCPTGPEFVVSRVTDQRTEFLELLESHGILPGRRIRVAHRDELAGTLEIAPAGGATLRLGFRAARTVRVERAEGDA